VTRRGPVAALLALGTLACGGGPSAEECAKVADHIAEIVAAPPASDKDTVQAAERWKKTLQTKDPSRQVILEMCAHRLKGGHVDCILGAKDEKTLARCLGG
jgi:hypothetical protein